MHEDPNATTTINLGSAMAMLASTRCVVSATDWQNPDEVTAAAEGVDACLAVVMDWLEQLAAEVGLADVVRERVEDSRRETMAMIAMHQNGGTA